MCKGEILKLRDELLVVWQNARAQPTAQVSFGEAFTSSHFTGELLKIHKNELAKYHGLLSDFASVYTRWEKLDELQDKHDKVSLSISKLNIK